VGEESPESLPVDANSTVRHFLRSTSHDHPLRIPRPVRPPAGAAKSGFNEYVSGDHRLPIPYFSPLYRFVVLMSTSMSAACLSAILLGSFMSFLVVLCRRLGRDPGAVKIPTISARCLTPCLQITLPRRLPPVWAISSP
jgi:solute carrier family 41